MPARKKVSPHTDIAEDEDVGDWREQVEWLEASPTAALVEARTRAHFGQLLALTRDREASFFEVERRLIPLLAALGRLLMALFLCRRDDALRTVPSEIVEGRRYERRRPQGRWLGTSYGRVRYWRTYMYGPDGGYYPLDRELGLPSSSCSTHLSGLMACMATKMSYAAATVVLRAFLSWTPSTTSVEKTVLGLGARTAAWFEQAPLPDDDGEVFVIQPDGKCPPTATEEELRKRRGKRKPPLVAGSQRHRGGKRTKLRRKKVRPTEVTDSKRHQRRRKRRERGKKPRRKKGQKAKNGRMVTTLVRYTLKRGVDAEDNLVLKGPVNRRVYASFAPKRHAFAIARREANRRGFTPESGKTVQIVMDGDEDLERYAKEFFPEAILTLDVYHAIEHLWTGGRSVHREGSKALVGWVDEQRDRLFRGHVKAVVRELQTALEAIPKTGPGNKGRRERLADTVSYFEKRIHMMNYAELIEQDLEYCSGAVEGAVRYVVSQRFDSAGMRWIRERAEALLQLRCIEINGDWDAFLEFVHATGPGNANAPPGRRGLMAKEPEPLPKLGVAA